MKNEQFELLVNLFDTSMNRLRDELKGDIQELRTELKGDIQEVRTELKDDIKQLSDSNDSQHRSIREELKRMNETLEYNALENRKQHAFMIDMLEKKSSKKRYE